MRSSSSSSSSSSVFALRAADHTCGESRRDHERSGDRATSLMTSVDGRDINTDVGNARPTTLLTALTRSRALLPET
jgi:hypothetical protein